MEPSPYRDVGSLPKRNQGLSLVSFERALGPWLDTFFGSDGSFRNTTKDAIAQYTLSAIAAPERARPPGGLILHPTLHPQIREALHSRDFLRDARNTMTFPVATEKD